MLVDAGMSFCLGVDNVHSACTVASISDKGLKSVAFASRALSANVTGTTTLVQSRTFITVA